MRAPDLRSIHQLLTSGKAGQAVAQLESTVTVDPSHTAALVLLAMAYEQSGRADDALAAWRRAYALCPDSPVVCEGVRRLATATAWDDLRKEADRAVDAAESVLRDGAPYHELDDLIQELEKARIVPDPEVETIDEATLDVAVDDVVSETLARIYANQKLFVEAAGVYEKLAMQQPGRRDEFTSKAVDLRRRAAR